MGIQKWVGTMSAALSVRRFEEAEPDTYPRGLPPWTYDHPAITRLELQRVLRPSWQMVCHTSNVPALGDYLTFELGPDSIVVLRDREGTLRAYHNVCRHRAARLLEQSGSCPGSITCPYHGWTYNLDGSLRGTPVRESFPALDRTQHGLIPVRLEIMAGLVFVCLQGDPPLPSSMWGDMLADFEPYQFEKMQPLFPMYTEEWDVDWKVAMDNYLESYHVPVGHPGLARMMVPDYKDSLNLESGVARGVGWLLDQPSSKWTERQYQSMVKGLATHLPEPNRKCWRFYSMLPNLGIDVYPDQMDFFQVLPRGPGKCLIRGGTYALPDARREMRVLRYLCNRINMQVNREDHDLCRRVQLGLKSSVYKPGPLSTLEVCILQFHDLIRTRIPETLREAAPSVFA
jgi:phenylpropionate dioxygenase-like ring-hydroxylating dioxygenase large terminal subunit